MLLHQLVYLLIVVVVVVVAVCCFLILVVVVVVAGVGVLFAGVLSRPYIMRASCLLENCGLTKRRRLTRLVC